MNYFRKPLYSAINGNCLNIRGNAAFRKVLVAGAFLREFIHSPTHVGSVCPSSRALTAALIRAAPADTDGIVIDLGAGSGIVSEELLRAGFAPDRILAVEVSSGFSKVFAERCPGVPLAIGDARNLGSILERRAPGRKVSAIISSLPFRVMPQALVRDILAEVRTVAADKGCSFAQYSYAWWMHYPLRKYGFAPCSAKIVLGNLPPARVELYTVH